MLIDGLGSEESILNSMLHSTLEVNLENDVTLHICISMDNERGKVLAGFISAKEPNTEVGSRSYRCPIITLKVKQRAKWWERLVVPPQATTTRNIRFVIRVTVKQRVSNRYTILEKPQSDSQWIENCKSHWTQNIPNKRVAKVKRKLFNFSFLDRQTKHSRLITRHLQQPRD